MRADLLAEARIQDPAMLPPVKQEVKVMLGCYKLKKRLG